MALYLILNGTADTLLEHSGGQVIHLRQMQAGDYFGELGLIAGERTAHVVARDSLTCLVLSRTPNTPYAGRGADATSAVQVPAAAMPPGIAVGAWLSCVMIDGTLIPWTRRRRAFYFRNTGMKDAIANR